MSVVCCAISGRSLKILFCEASKVAVDLSLSPPEVNGRLLFLNQLIVLFLREVMRRWDEVVFGGASTSLGAILQPESWL